MHVLLHITERPDPIESVTVRSMGSHWALIEWNVPYNGNSEIMGYIVYTRNVQSDSNFIPVISSSSAGKRQTKFSQFTTTGTNYNVTEHILPATLYQFTAVACNELGCGELGQPSLTILTEEERKHNLK